MARVDGLQERVSAVGGDVAAAVPVPDAAVPGIIPLGPREPSLPAATSKLLPGMPAPRTQSVVSLRIKADNGAGTRTVTLPRERFDLVDGKPTRLSGPNVRVIVDAPLYTNLGERPAEGKPSRFPVVASREVPATANAAGQFDAPDIDLAQTTAFFAAQSVHDWATRTAGRAIDWTQGALPVTVHAWVTSTPETLNAFYDNFGSAGVALGTYGSVRDGRVVPYTGAGVPFLDTAARLAPFGFDFEDPVEPEEATRRENVLATVASALRRR